MINTNRIVPVTAIDLLSLYGLIIKAGGTTLTKIDAATVEGDFVVTAAANALICSEPMKSLAFSGVSSATIYFVPTYDYEGFKDVTNSGEVEKDGRTLYSATLATGTVTIAKVGF